VKRGPPEARHAPAAAEAPRPAISTDSILESISDGVFTVDRAWRVTSFNRAAEEITGIAREDALGRRCSDVFRASMCESECALRHTLDTGVPVVNRAAFIVDDEGRRIPVSVSTAILRDADGAVVGGAETFRDLSQIEELRKEVLDRREAGDIVARSDAMCRILGLLPRAAESGSTILLLGETGTGKGLVARALHDLSPRRDGPFVTVNCGALPDTLLESELFGYKAGAFTGATKDKAGRFAIARGGTLFLDEIGEVTPALQVRLLGVLQDGLYEPLGATRSEEADVRVVAATNRDLAADVATGRFRRDLYWRIRVMEVVLPPLRERREDIPPLVERFVARLNVLKGRQVEGVTPEAMAVLTAHDFPGNARELLNAIEHAFVLIGKGRIGPEHLPRELLPAAARRRRPVNLREAVSEFERRAILEALRRRRGSRAAAARDLGLHKSTLFRKAKSLGLALPEEDGRSRREGPDRPKEN
jgi:PAS domain S-box-containing protein